MWRWCSRSSASGGCAPGIAALLDRRLVAPQALRRFLQKGPRDLTAAVGVRGVGGAPARHASPASRGGLDAFLDDGPRHHPQFAMLAADIRASLRRTAIEHVRVRDRDASRRRSAR